jgi:ribonuclease P/MRP protein subunit POP5
VKHLPKHLRPRWRYLAVEIETWPDADLSRRTFQRALWYAAGNLLGDPGSADANLRVLGFSFASGEGEAVLRVRHGEVGPARAAVACVDEVNDQPVRLRVRGVSGTVRACEEKYMRGPVKERVEKRVVFRNATRRATQRGVGVDIKTASEGGGPAFTGATRLDIQ